MGGGGSPSGNTTTTTKSDPWEGQQPYLKTGFENISEFFTNPGQIDQQKVSGLQSQIAAMQQQANSWTPGATGEGGSTQGQTNPYTSQLAALQSQLAEAQNPAQRVIDPSALPNYYPGQTIADNSPETNLALQMRTGRALYGSPLTSAAQNQLTQTLRGDYLNSNPYIDATFNQAAGNVVNKYNEIINPGIDSAFAKSGRYGSGAYAQARNQGDRTAAQELGNLATNIYGQNYANERQNQIQGQLYAPDLANQDYYDINQLSTVGDYNTNLAQAQIDADREKYAYNANKPLTALQAYQQMIQGDYGGTQTQTNPYYRNSAGSAIGGIAQGAGALASIGSLFGFSDERLKDNIKPVGTENGHKIYEFNYKGDDTKYIGVMAQDLIKTAPHAVGMRKGFLTVNYDAIGVKMRMA